MSWRAASGLHAWLAQRISALYMAFFLFYFLGALAFCQPDSYQAWRDWFASTPMQLATAGFFIALFWHAWVGIRDVFIDYIKPFAIRIGLLVLLAMTMMLLMLWVIKIFLAGAL